MRRLLIVLAFVAAWGCSDTVTRQTGGSGGGGVGGDGVGGDAVDCDAIEVAYAAALADAKECAPQLSIALCTEFVDDDVACPCMGAFVNPQNVDALAELAALEVEWSNSGCDALVDCAAIGCVQPTQGFCIPDATGMNGSCGVSP
jgi:hypothetical protein